ncbi:S8 family serine peptidase [Nonomuraea soli]|uniref:Subtilisin family serine protease n=1 Tax=Nonomuraea soli TaxID=1032476 RepID=A0A7W0CP84_9ACTN|nr:S8 family serine peptidase [Nonomuraea soli]MBA2894792.1 subtilisin family serine protease [Nonomuraea soli]
MSRTPRAHRALALAAALAVTAAATPAIAEPAPAGDPSTYIVTLAERPLATYDGGVAGIAATKPGKGRKVDTTSPDAKRYRERLTSRHDQVAASVGATASGHYSVVSNGFTAELTPAQAVRLHTTAGVVSVVPDRLHKALDDRNSSDFLGLSGEGGLWSALGGTAEAGKGIVVGVIDTGIWPENPSFAGPELGDEPPTQADPYRPYRSGTTTVMRKADGSTFTGTCQTGQEFTADLCNQKLVSARYFGKGWLAGNDPAALGEYVSPRDGGGHGSHTAGTAAGNHGVAASVNGIGHGTISGVAPGAAIAVYKALWNDQGTTTDILAAIDQAVADGVDVINYSVGGQSESPVLDPINIAFLHAAAAGVFVAAAGGNSGPSASTLDNTMPWVTTVAATTIAPYLGDVRLGDGTLLHGASSTVTAPYGPHPLAVATSVKAGAATDDDASQCAAGSLDPAKAAGKIIYCVRGVTPRVDKSAEVKRAGGVGMILGNPSDQDTLGDAHTVPSVHINHPDTGTLTAYAATQGATATLLPATSGGPSYPQVAAFSSRGPSTTNQADLLKPDISAPGVAILAAVSPPGNQGKDFDFYSGTSMATPHIAGLAALYLGEHPTMSPSSIKSAMMTTAYDTKTPDLHAQGAGHVDPARMLRPGLVYDATYADWLGYVEGLGIDTQTGVAPIATSNLNYPSIAVGRLFGTRTITRRVTALTPGVYHATLDLPGFKTKVTPSTLVFKTAGETKEFAVRIEMTAKTGSTTTPGTLTWTSGDTTVRSPLVVTPLSAQAPAEVNGTGTDGSVTFDVVPGVDKFPLAAYGPVSADHVPGTVSPSEIWGKEIAVQVPEDAKALAFHLTPGSDQEVGALVFSEGEHGREFEAWVTRWEDFRTVLARPKARTYIMVVVTLGNTDTPYSTQVNLVTAQSVGTLRAEPRKGKVTPGVAFPVTATWTGAGERRGTGYIEYPNGTGTVVTIN